MNYDLTKYWRKHNEWDEAIQYIKMLEDREKQLREENQYLKLNSPASDIEHLRIVKENKRKIDNLRKQNKELKRNCNIGNENLSFYIQQNKKLHNKIDKAIELNEEIDKSLRMKNTSAYIQLEDIIFKQWKILKDSDVDE